MKNVLIQFSVSAILLVIATAALAQSTEVSARETFEYLGAGLGPEAVYNKLLLKPGAADATLSWVLIKAVQKQQLSFAGLDAQHPDILTRGKWYSTGAHVSLDAQRVAEHNRQYPRMQLQGGYLYSVQYALRYDYDSASRTLTIGCKAILYRKGSSSPDRAVQQKYSGEFFALPVLGDIRDHLALLKQLQRPVWL